MNTVSQTQRVSITINSVPITAEAGTTVLQAALANKIDIPHLCYHPDIPKEGSCSLCLVELEGEKELKHACELRVKEGMNVRTDSERVKKEVSQILEAILREHTLECNDCVRFQKCELLALSQAYGIQPKPKQKPEAYTFETGSLFYDQAKCIGCENCVTVCPTGVLGMNSGQKAELSEDETIDCVNCGQCIGACPVGAMEGEGEFENIAKLQKLFDDKEKVIVAQFAPSIRTSIGEEFGTEPGTVATGQLVSGLKQAGFQHVFDTATGADFTTMEESEELLERLASNERLPAMTSCCPAWVKFLEFNYPQFIPNLCTSRSPHIMLGALIKEYWAKENNIHPDDVVVVSVMPCIAKKEEIKREELKVNGRFPVDMVITTREAARLLKAKKIILQKLQESNVEDLFGEPSGAGVIYGSSGGVFESALRTAFFKAGEKGIPEIHDIRGSEGVKKKVITIGGRSIKVRVVSGIRNAVKALQELENDGQAFEALEVMACPGGCVGGGGQPVPSNAGIVSKRSKALYDIDEKESVRCAHDNLSVQKVYDTFLSSVKTRKALLHTRYAPRTKTSIRKKRR